uniref:Peptidase A1 domain-containing protein n=1 Tax=Oryza glumipatula TaxID=40148 RepID=A0A0E0B386_9ORYZ
MARLPSHRLAALLLLLVVVSPCHAAAAAAAAGGGPRATRPKAVAMPVGRDGATRQYVATFQQRTPRVAVKAVVDLSGGATLWVDCDAAAGYASSSYAGVPCGSKPCRLVESPSCSYIASCLGSPPSPACLNRTCTGHAENTVTSSVGRGNVVTDVLSLPTTFPSAPVRQGPLATAPAFLFTCGPTSLTQGLAAGATGMASLSRARLALPAQLAGTFRFSRKFALCLPSVDAGVVVFGDARYVFDGMDHSNSLLYTPLITRTTDRSSEYFISLKRVVVDDRAVPLNATLLDVGTKMSTVSPYTVLETSIHEAVTRAFAASMATAGIPRVPAVAPFELCYDGSKVESSAITGEPAVPVVFELYVQSEARSKVAPWMVSGANLMARADGGALCLAVVDGGAAPETPVVIGGHMMEEILLVFDLEKSRLGFSPNLGAFGLSCSKFRLG